MEEQRRGKGLNDTAIKRKERRAAQTELFLLCTKYKTAKLNLIPQWEGGGGGGERRRKGEGKTKRAAMVN